MKKKPFSSKGFGLKELLVFVVIIIVIVAASLLYSNAEIERVAMLADFANENAAENCATAMYLKDEIDFDNTYVVLNYDSQNDTLTKDVPATYGKCSSHKGGYLVVKITNQGNTTVTWSNEAALHSDPTVES